MSLTKKELDLADKCIRAKVRLLQGWVAACGPNIRFRGLPKDKRKLKSIQKEILELQSLLRSIWDLRVETSE